MEATRHTILELADRMVIDVNRLSMTELAKASNISRHTLYKIFPDRTTILMALADKHLLGFDYTEDLPSFVAACGDFIYTHQNLLRMILAAGQSDKKVDAYFADLEKQHKNASSDVVMSLYQADGLSMDWTISSATAVLAQATSVRAWLHLSETCEWTHDSYRRRQTRLLVGALCVGEAQNKSEVKLKLSA